MSQAAPLKVLSDAEVREVHDAALDILAECGVFIDYPRALEHLAAKGAQVDMASGRVRLPRTLVEEALRTCPSTFALYDRDGNEALRVGGDEVHFATSSCAVRFQEGAEAPGRRSPPSWPRAHARSNPSGRPSSTRPCGG